MRNILEITRALGDENRIRALMMLRTGELCVCQIIEMLNLAPSTVSKHMSILKQARLVESRKEGRWINYRLADPTATQAVQDVLGWLGQHLADTPGIIADKEKLEILLTRDREELCKKQNKK